MTSPFQGRGAPTDTRRLLARALAIVIVSFPLALACCRGATTTTPAALHGPGREPASDNTEVMDRYYLHTCATCGSELGSKGEAVARLFGGREVRFCCDSCAVAFASTLEASIEGLDRVIIADQIPHYPLQTCAVSGKALPATPTDVVWGNRMFRVAGETERAMLLARPNVYTQTLNDAVRSAQTPTYGMPDKCPVQGDILEGDPVMDIVIANRMVRVCCGRCARIVRSSPYQYIAMVDYANRAAAAEGRGTPPR